MKYIYEDDFIKCESFINEFTSELFDNFNYKSEKLGIRSKISNLIEGVVVNKSENQGAWHPKYRKAGPTHSNILKKKIQKLEEIKNISSINILVIGIGGSYEGPKLLVEALKSTSSYEKYNIEFITGSDRNEFKHKTYSLDPSETIFIISSKSFTTDETIEILKDALKWSNDTDNFIAITSNANEPKKYGLKNANIISFDKEIGGRYSIWSSIAEIPLLEDNAYESFIQGGNHSDKEILCNDSYLGFVKRLSFSDIWLHNMKNFNVRVVLSYIWSLRSLSDYIQQLEMESLGKHPNPNSGFKKTGQIVFGGYGPTAQHSYFQLLHQGTQNICADIISSIEDKKSLAFAQAVTQSNLLSQGADHLKEKEKINGNMPVNHFNLIKMNPFTIGYLISTWEYRTFITALMLDINPFDQFGVSAGKIYTKKYLNKD
tara:strand:- start:4602 stop:5894 length:1293 start_codon:yes stop_codon:yes gene_type:complete